MTEYQLKCLTSLIMAADPSPISAEESQAIRDFADEESRRHGYEDWIDAYHALPGTSLQGDSETQEPEPLFGDPGFPELKRDCKHDMGHEFHPDGSATCCLCGDTIRTTKQDKDNGS